MLIDKIKREVANFARSIYHLEGTPSLTNKRTDVPYRTAGNDPRPFGFPYHGKTIEVHPFSPNLTHMQILIINKLGEAKVLCRSVKIT